MRYRLLTETIERLSARHQTVLATFLRFRKPLYSCTEGMCHSSIRPGTSYHMTQFYQAFPHVNTASDERTGARRPGYEATKHPVARYKVEVLSPNFGVLICWCAHTRKHIVNDRSDISSQSTDGFHGTLYNGNWRALHHHAAC